MLAVKLTSSNLGATVRQHAEVAARRGDSLDELLEWVIGKLASWREEKGGPIGRRDAQDGDWAADIAIRAYEAELARLTGPNSIPKVAS